ncbi:NUDIX hydrolase [Hippea alviniae]|uniref:NUDIX hydrolase n=1 Tax=Hippea alviniae TaxID=1279027 RepID=UPI0003B46929|nr:CoA pyrophosphatase [Hippea alviniae]
MFRNKKWLKSIFSLNISEEISNQSRISAVIIPFLPKNGEWFLIFEKKAKSLRKHAGQISFPGGIKEPNDKTLLHTAIRETCEEIGICENDIEIIGNIEPTKTLTTDYLIYPFVGIVNRQPPYKINPDEVEKLLFVPLNFLIEHYPIKKGKLNYNGKIRETPLVEYEGEIIWGATARILNKLLPKLL